MGLPLVTVVPKLVSVLAASANAYEVQVETLQAAGSLFASARQLVPLVDPYQQCEPVTVMPLAWALVSVAVMCVASAIAVMVEVSRLPAVSRLMPWLTVKAALDAPGMLIAAPATTAAVVGVVLIKGVRKVWSVYCWISS